MDVIECNMKVLGREASRNVLTLRFWNCPEVRNLLSHVELQARVL